MFKSITYELNDVVYALRVKQGEKTRQTLYKVIPEDEEITMYNWHESPEKAIAVYLKIISTYKRVLEKC